MTGIWVEPDKRDQIVDFVRRWSKKAEVAAEKFIEWLGIAAGKYYQWRKRYGKANEHNGWVPRDFWLRDWEKRRILDFQSQYPMEGYRRLTYMMIDADAVAVSPSSVYRVLHEAGRLSKFSGRPSKKGLVLSNPRPRTSTGTSTSRTSIFTAPSTICARCSTEPAVTSWNGICGNR